MEEDMVKIVGEGRERLMIELVKKIVIDSIEPWMK